jgi:hypothetical protein
MLNCKKLSIEIEFLKTRCQKLEERCYDINQKIEKISRSKSILTNVKKEKSNEE